MSEAIAILFLIPGLVGTLYPVVPAVPYMFVVTLVYALFTQFARLAGWELAILAGLALVSFLVDQLSGILGAKYGGASKRALLFGFVGALAGTIFAGPVGGFVGVFTGIMIAELSQLRGHITALKAATGGLLGALAGMLVNIVIGLIFFVCFIVFVY